MSRPDKDTFPGRLYVSISTPPHKSVSSIFATDRPEGHSGEARIYVPVERVEELEREKVNLVTLYEVMEKLQHDNACKLEAKLQRYRKLAEKQQTLLDLVLLAINCELCEVPGTYHSLRDYLNLEGIYNDDLTGLRVIQAAIRSSRQKARELLEDK